MAARFWVGGTGTWDSSDTTHWAATSGGAGGQSVPGASDSATFDANSGGGTVTPNYNFNIGQLSAGAFTGTLDFSANNNSPTVTGLSISGSGTRTINLGSGTFTITGANGWNATTVTNLTLNAGTSTIKLTFTGVGTYIFAGGGKTYYNVWFSRVSLNPTAIISGSNTFNELKVDTPTVAHNLGFRSGTTQTIGTFTVSGSAGNLISLRSYDVLNAVDTAVHNLVKSGGGVVSCDYLNIRNSVATPGSTWYAGANSVDNNSSATAGSGWIFTAPPSTSISNLTLLNVG